MADEKDQNLRGLVATVAAAYFANSNVATGDIGVVIAQIAKSLGAVGDAAVDTTPTEQSAPARLNPSQVRRSITPEALISFEDGRKYKTLRRHLSAKGLTADTYREKWGLPDDYPMVAASYSARRSVMAKDAGLGGQRANAGLSEIKAMWARTPKTKGPK